MKLKQATQLAIIGVILQLVQLLLLEIQFSYTPPYLTIISIIGIALLLPFFIILLKNQK